MSQKLVVFLSSTIRDLGEVRQELQLKLEQRKIEVRASENPGFPVAPGVTSHDACLQAVRSSHVFVLLVGSRFGGEYQQQNKSITWREWEEAMSAGLFLIVLVNRETNDLAIELFEARKELRGQHPKAPIITIDNLLRQDPRFADQAPKRHNLPGVQRFIDELRRGHVDNWMYSEWDGTAKEALLQIDSSLSTALATYRKQQTSLRDIAVRERLRTDALRRAFSLAVSLAMKVMTSRMLVDRAVGLLLERLADDRDSLLGFRDRDHHNFVVYLRSGEELLPYARKSHSEIPSHNRIWRVGQGHIGLAMKTNRLLTSGDIRNTEAWVPAEERETDRAFYVSAVSVPFSFPTKGGDLEGVLTVTSSRLDHFREPSQVEVLTVGTLGDMLRTVLSAGEPVRKSTP